MHLRLPLLLDGPMGTELQRRGARLEDPLWSATALLNDPGLVERIHLDYLEAGANVVTTNSFRTNRRTVERAGLNTGAARDLTRRSVEIARNAIERSGRKDVLVAGSDAPVEDCYSPELAPADADVVDEHAEHIGWLVEAGCDIVLIETMNTMREAVAACRAATSVGAPFIVSLVTDRSGEWVLSGEPLHYAAEVLAESGPVAIMTNCASPSATLRACELLWGLRETSGGAWEFGGYANSGEPDPLLGYERVTITPVEEYVAIAQRMLGLGAGIIGSCCGTTPEYTALLRREIDRELERLGFTDG